MKRPHTAASSRQPPPSISSLWVWEQSGAKRCCFTGVSTLTRHKINPPIMFLQIQGDDSVLTSPPKSPSVRSARRKWIVGRKKNSTKFHADTQTPSPRRRRISMQQVQLPRYLLLPPSDSNEVRSQERRVHTHSTLGQMSVSLRRAWSGWGFHPWPRSSRMLVMWMCEWCSDVFKSGFEIQC